MRKYRRFAIALEVVSAPAIMASEPRKERTFSTVSTVVGDLHTVTNDLGNRRWPRRDTVFINL